MRARGPGRTNQALILAADRNTALTNAGQATSLDTLLRRIGTVTRGWGGDVLDPQGSLHHVHETPMRPRLFWCFNANHEFDALAQALGAGQPLVGMRSMNKVAEPLALRSALGDALAGHYAQHLLTRFGTAPCIVGGNCQAAGLAWRVAQRLMQAGVPVLRLVTLDAQPRFPFAGHLRMLFGQDSGFGTQDGAGPIAIPQALRGWRYAAQRLDVHKVQGSHGQYFVPENVASLARAILSPAPPAAAAPLPMPSPRWRIARLDTAAVTLQAAAPVAQGDLAVVPVWRKEDGAIFRIEGGDWVLPLDNAPTWTCRIPRPDSPGPWGLWPVLCAMDSGPLQWPQPPQDRMVFR
ncbi:alpha/beta hydrolase family protein [Tropicibacter oceani]|uniref:Uncharacterized protein n=1 Tax=Tropicibacter oceani TaxID=3058420 RepID=A0ABY8QGT0_9RHOB|nr:hypothetical protein [Tropicibacter oceani]WGW03643.1 hypothetical protein QF118_17250 [Tropicibacter oceani]